MTTILDTLKNTADEEKAATALAAFARENPEALETSIKVLLGRRFHSSSASSPVYCCTGILCCFLPRMLQ